MQTDIKYILLKIIQAIPILLVGFLTFLVATNGHAKGRVQFQMEAGFNITEDLAKTISDSYEFSSEDRHDYYFDAYDGQNFLISDSPEGYKLRLKSKSGKEGVFQANTKSAIYDRVCPEGYKFKVRVKNVGELKLDPKEEQPYIKLALSIADHVAKPLVSDQTSNQKTIILLSELIDLEELILDLNLPLLEKILTVLEHKRFVILSTHHSKKIKKKAMLSTGIEFSLTQSDDYVGKDFIQTKYEIEFQTEDKKAAKIESFSQSVCDFMKKLNPDNLDLAPARVDTEAIMRKRLEPYRELFNLVP